MIFLGLSTASSSRLTERTKTLGEWFPLCHWALQCDAEQTQALLETINWFQRRLWHRANPCSVQQGVGALTEQGLGIQVKKEMKLEIAHSGSVVLSTAFQEAQEHSIMILKVSSNPKASMIAHSSPLVWSQKGFRELSCLQPLLQSISAPWLSHALPPGLVQQHIPT